MNNKPELVVFDLAGTTVEDNHDVHRCLVLAMEQYHVGITQEEANDVMGIPKPIAIERLLKLHNQPDIKAAMINDIHATFVRTMIEFYRYNPDVKEKDGVSDTFRQLKRSGIKVAVDTGFDRLITSALLDRMGWSKSNLIDASVTSDEVDRGRPFPDLIFKSMLQTGVTDVKTVAKVGDTASDIQEGKSAGCTWVIGITSGAFSAAQLQKESPTHMIVNIPELLPLFGLE